MATTLALAMRASMSAGGLVSGSKEASAALDRMGKHARQAASDLSLLKNLAIGSTIARGVTAASNAIASYAAQVTTAVDATNDLAQRVGFSVESLQALQMAAKLSGVNDATTAIQKMTVAIGAAAESGKTEAFTKLGIDFEKLQAMSPEEQFRTIQAAIAALPTPAERAAAAVALFGRSGVELLPLMEQNLAAVEERMRRLGAIVGTDQVEAIGAMNDALDMVRATFDGIIGQVVGNLAPIVESLANEFLEFVESFNSVNGEGGTGIANTISEALLDVADYMAGVFDTAVAGFDGFGVTMADVGAVFQTVGNIFTAFTETLRAAFNVFQVAGNLLAEGLGRFLEGIGSWVSSDLEAFGRDMASRAAEQRNKNMAEAADAGANAASAAGRAVFGGEAGTAPEGPAQRAVRAARERMTPEERERRQKEREAKAEQDKAAREAAAAEAKAKKDAEAAQKRQEQAAKDAAKLMEQAAGKQEDIDKVQAERQAALSGTSNESLKANDIRSSEGMAQFLALATGREDPAIAEYRKQTQKLDEMKAELRALNQQAVDILGAAA
jgi:hypothetical protein